MNICPNCLFRGEVKTCPHDGFPMVSEGLFDEKSREPDLVGKVVDGKYEVMELLGTGAMGTVWRAVHKLTQQQVALKVLRVGVHHSLQAVQRFLREARACSRLSHPNAIRVYDFGTTEEGFLFMALELLKGTDLRSILKEHKSLHPLRAVRIAIQACEALSEAHANGIVHRDLKPSNIFLVDVHLKQDFVKVIDFGISRYAQEDSQLTGAGIVVGTPRYMSPEQAQGQGTDARADLYSFGIILYEMLTGDIPFKANTTGALLAAHIAAPPRPLPNEARGVRLPQSLLSLMAALLAKKPEQRPTSAAVVHEELCTIEQEIASMEGIEATGVGGRSRSGVRPVLPPPDLPPLPETPEEAREQPVEGDVQAAAQAKPAPEAPPPPVPTPVGPPTSREMRRGGRGVFATTEKDAWQITMTGRRSMFLLIAAGLAVVVLAILLIANMSRDTGPGSVVDAGAVASRPDVEAAVPPAVAAQQVDNAEANSAAQDTAPAAADVVKAPVEEVVRRVTIESVPPGAVVSLAGRRRPEGRTPVTVEIEPGKAVRAQLSLGGYHGATVVLAPEGPDRYTVRLNRVDIVVPF